MTKVIIPQKMSGTGTIHDLASDLYDREIRFRKNTPYAVVLPSYYNCSPRLAKTEKGAIRLLKLERERGYESVAVIDSQGNTLIDYADRLIIDKNVEPYKVEQ